MSLVTGLRSLRSEVGDLLERHERARDLGEFQRYADDPIGFVREVLGETKPGPWSGQVEIAESVRDHPLTVVRSCNSAGKDWAASAIALWWVYARRGLVLLTGPTERQVREIVMSEVARFWIRTGDLPGELFATALRLGREERAGILAFTSTEASRLTGFHAPRILAIATEAQAVEDFAYEGLLACAAGDEDRLLAVGNPLQPSGRFYEICNSENWRSFQFSAFDHPNVREDRVLIPGGVTTRFVERMRAEYGADSGIYKSRVLGEFPDQGQESLFRRTWLEAAAQRYESGEFWADGDRKREPVLGVDVARFGADRTVVAIRRGSTLVRFEDWRGADTVESAERVEELALGLGAHPRYETDHPDFRRAKGMILVDEIGIGAGVLDNLRKRRWRASGYNAGRSAMKDRRFRNVRAESYWALRKLLEGGKIALPRDEELFAELLATGWYATPDGRVAIADKDVIKGQLGRSPDKADAAAIAFYEDARSVVRFRRFKVV